MVGDGVNDAPAIVAAFSLPCEHDLTLPNWHVCVTLQGHVVATTGDGVNYTPAFIPSFPLIPLPFTSSHTCRDMWWQ